MRETSEIPEIIAILRTAESRFIGIDGMDGSGKSSLASSLSRETGWRHIHLDKYLEKDRAQYVNYIRYGELQTEVDNVKQPIIVEGVCLLAALERLQRHPDILIYVKRVAHYGMWRDEEDCDVVEDIDEFITKKKKELLNLGPTVARIAGKEPVLSQLKEEIIRYHYKYRPHEKAQIVYKRVD